MMSSLSRLNGDSPTVQLTSFSQVKTALSEKVDSTTKQECAKYVAELNHLTAVYCTHVVCLGGSQDSDDLREELKRMRIQAIELARTNRLKLVPTLRNKLLCPEDVKDLEKIYNMFSACLEYFEIQLLKTLFVQREFPLHSDVKILINTGWAEPFSICKKHTVTLESLDNTQCEKKLAETEEIKILEKDISDLQELLYNINNLIAVQPWEVDPDVGTGATECSNSDNSSDTSSTSSLNVQRGIRQGYKRKRCVIIITVSCILLISVVITTIVLLQESPFS
ncbi:regulator of G-protein signaling 9-binding protein-like [Mytilus galloprovincialis]|uniref:Uncharacterized protein n=2 Tax=Mytilus galloprovincialis TaxID=29158 RepID=A0A8B6G0L2_MYTGA|nr:Hypothetical predicted protein [Mytilus galloprovincialis]